MQRHEAQTDAPTKDATGDVSSHALFHAAYEASPPQVGAAHADSVPKSSTQGLMDTIKSDWNTVASILSNFSLITPAKADTLIDTGGGTYIDANDGSFIPTTVDQGGGNYYVPSQGRSIHRDN